MLIFRSGIAVSGVSLGNSRAAHQPHVVGVILLDGTHAGAGLTGTSHNRVTNLGTPKQVYTPRMGTHNSPLDNLRSAGG